MLFCSQSVVFAIAWVLGEGLFMEMKPTKRQRAISKQIIEGLSSAEVVKGIVTCRFGEWENYARLLALVGRVYPAKKLAIVQSMDWKAFDAVVSKQLEKPGREFSLLLNSKFCFFVLVFHLQQRSSGKLA